MSPAAATGSIPTGEDAANLDDVIEPPETTGFRATLRRMSVAQKPGRGAPPYSRWINRRMGRVIAAAAHGTPLTPNGITGISAIFTFSALALIALVPPAAWLGPVVAVLLVLGYAFDSADGQLARLRGRGSRRGEWLDHMVDVTKTCVLHAVVAVSLYRFAEVSPLVLLIPLGYLTVSVVLFFGQMLVDQLRRSAPGGAPAKPTGGGLLQTAVALPVDYGILCLVFVLFGWPTAFLVVYTLFFAAHTVVLLGALAKWWRELGAIDSRDRG